MKTSWLTKRQSKKERETLFLKGFLGLFLLLLLNGSLTAQHQIKIWYGPKQYFGQNGEPQRWINVLGNVANADEVEEVTYSINGSAPKSLTLGSDQHRLALAGDFNVELAWEEVHAGTNELLIQALWKDGTTAGQQVQLQVERGNSWPLPYSVDFTKVDDLQKVVQVVDGDWELTPNGVRTRQPYYDRVLSMGDTNWVNFETNVRLTVNDFTPSEPGPPTYNVTHFGVAMRWRGHHTDGRQPSRKWFPLGAQGELLLKENPDSCRWRILFDGRMQEKPPQYTPRRNRVILGQPIRIRTQVATLPDGRTRYRYKQWPDGEPEPLGWDVEGFEHNDYRSGALCLVPHNSDVTIHEVRVQPLIIPEMDYSARPGPGNLHRTAPVGGLAGADGTAFVQPITGTLEAIQVNLGPAPLLLVKGIRLRTKAGKGQAEEALIGQEDGNWQDWFEVPEGSRLIGISGASGWYFDALQFHFTNGVDSPRYGGSGGDTTFDLRLNKKGEAYPGKIRGLYGTYTAQGLETLGYFFDPAD